MNTFFVFADADIAARHDPTWLYSTLAQTAGALVGLLGAVLISRVISHIAALETPIAQVRQRAIGVLNQVAENAQTAGGRQNVESFGLEGIAWYALVLERHRKLQLQLAGAIKPERLPDYIAILRECIDAYPPTANQSLQSNDIRGNIQNAVIHLELLGESIVGLQSRLVPRPLWAVFWILVWLTVVGVAWPMAELWLLTDMAPPRMVTLVTAFVVGVLALVGYFGYLLCELLSLGRFRWVRPR